MRGFTLLRVSWFTAMMAILAGPGVANDSSSVLAVGGLVLVRTDAISIQREDLSLSPREVRVRYEMRNNQSAPVTLRVAFPLPELPVDTPAGLDITGAGDQPAAHMIDLPTHGRPNFVGFNVWVDGKLLDPDVEVRAILPDGRNIAEALREIGGWWLVEHPMLFIADLSPRRMAEYNIGPTILRKLRELGAVEGNDTSSWPIWRTYITFHWLQVFNPGVTLIEHRYQPVVGSFGFSRQGNKWIGGAAGESDRLDDVYCIDAAKSQVLQEQASRDRYGYLTANSLAYILTTGANWAGPIGTFHLIVDARNSPWRGGTVGMIALCADMPLKQIGPLQVEGNMENYVPKNDLRVLMVMEPPK